MSARRLANRVALVSGAGSAIGRGIAQRLAREEASLVLVDDDVASAARTRESIESAGGVAHVAARAPTERAGADLLVTDALSRFGRIDILIACADYRTAFEPLADKSAASFGQSMRSFHEALFLMQALFPAMRANGGGSIVALGSTYGHFTQRFIADYKATKEAVRGLVFSAAHEWAPFDIRVNLLEAAADTEEFQSLRAQRGDEIDARIALLPMRRMGNVVNDIGGAALFLASDDSRYLTGEIIRADGGEHLSTPVFDPDPTLKATV